MPLPGLCGRPIAHLLIDTKQNVANGLHECSVVPGVVYDSQAPFVHNVQLSTVFQ